MAKKIKVINLAEAKSKLLKLSGEARTQAALENIYNENKVIDVIEVKSQTYLVVE